MRPDGAPTPPPSAAGHKVASPAASTQLLTRGFVIVWTASLIYNLAFQMTAAALPLFAVGLGATDTQIGLMIGLFALAAMLGRTVVGWQLDRGAKRLVLAAGGLIFVLSSLGHAAGQAANQTLVAETAPPQRRGEALSMQQVTLVLAVATMPALGVAMANQFGFPALYLVTATLSLVAALVALTCPEPPAPAVRPKPTFFNADVIRPGLVLFALMTSFGAVVGLAAVHAARVGLTNPGLFFLAYALGSLAVQFIGGRLSDTRGRAAVILPGLALAALGMAAIALAQGWWLLPAAALFGAGLGLGQPALFALAADGVAPARRGSALATTGIFLEGGISAGATAAGVIGQVAGLSVAFLALGALPALALVVLLARGWGRRIPRR